MLALARRQVVYPQSLYTFFCFLASHILLGETFLPAVTPVVLLLDAVGTAAVFF